MEYQSQNCPLCDMSAEWYPVDHGNRKYFRCEYCTDYQLYIHAEKHLVLASEERKKQLSEVSHDSPHEKVLFITWRPDKENPVKGFTLQAEFCDRATLPLR